MPKDLDYPVLVGRRMEMKSVEILCLALVLALGSSIGVRGQSESPLASQIIRVLKEKEPAWRPIVGIESSRVPLVPSEKRILVATWNCEQSGGISEGVSVFIYGVENPEQAAEWLRSIRSKQVAPGWRISSYPIGDEGYLAKYQAGKRFEIHFRKGSTVGKIAGNDLRRVRQFAKYIVDEVAAM